MHPKIKRRKCPACRLKKCQKVGMKPEFVINKPRTITKQKQPKKHKIIKLSILNIFCVY